jgi:hypothetical protein
MAISSHAAMQCGGWTGGGGGGGVVEFYFTAEFKLVAGSMQAGLPGRSRSRMRIVKVLPPTPLTKEEEVWLTAAAAAIKFLQASALTENLVNTTSRNALPDNAITRLTLFIPKFV